MAEDNIKIWAVASKSPIAGHWADSAPRELTPETHILQTLRVSPEMPLGDFVRLFLVDEDLGLRFVRKSRDALTPGAEVEILWRREDELEIAIGVRRESDADDA